MSRWIDIDDSRNCYCGSDGEYEKWNIDPDVLAEARTNVEERKQGKWEYKMVNEGVIGFRCSACGDEVLLPTPFCRNYGIEMRKVNR